IYSNAYPALVFRPIEDAVGNRFAALLIHQVGNSNLHRVAFWLPFPSAVLEVPDEFFLLGVDRNHRLTALLKGTPQGMDIFERFISIRMGIAFSRLAIALPAVARLVQQTAHGRVATSVSLVGQFTRQGSRALARPSQRRLRVTARHRVNEVLPCLRPFWVFFCFGF